MAGVGIVVASFTALLMWGEHQGDEPAGMRESMARRLPPRRWLALRLKLEGSYRKRRPDGSVVIVERAVQLILIGFV